ncbi:MAG: glycoside hydrolase family 43 protein [Planctomycetota bacterium]
MNLQADDATQTRRNGEPWRAEDGSVLNAHGGCVIRHDGFYYWYGEDRAGTTQEEGLPYARTDAGGVTCYRSADLDAWTPLGHVLRTRRDAPHHDLSVDRVCERPKVVFNARTGRFVMWLHIDDADYGKAAVGVAVADRPEGPFRYLYSLRPQGRDSRDQTVYVDADGTAYHLCATDGNRTLLISRLDEDYLTLTGDHAEALTDGWFEAPAVFRHDGRYWMLGSGCTGWEPNAAKLTVADDVLGPWRPLGNPCRGPGADLTFGCQVNFVLERPGLAPIAMFDRWVPADLANSGHAWLPVASDPGGVVVPWSETPSLD